MMAVPVTKIGKTIEIALTIKRQTGKLPNRELLAVAAKVRHDVADDALKLIKSGKVADIATVPPFTKAQKHHIDAQIKLKHLALEREFEARVTKEVKARIDILFPTLEKLRSDAKNTEVLYREQLAKIAVFTEAEYVDILFCTQNEHVSAERRARAFIAFHPKRLRLTGKE